MGIVQAYSVTLCPPQTRWVNHHQLFASKRNILIPRLLKMILFEINRFAPPAAIWFCVVASFNSDFEINYIFWSDRTGWFVYRRLGASKLEFNNPQNVRTGRIVDSGFVCMGLFKPTPPQSLCSKTEHLDPPMTKSDTV